MTPGGRVAIYVGRSSRDIQLTGSVTVPAAREVVSPRGPITGIGGKCVDVAGGSSANGTAVQLYAATAPPPSAGPSPTDGTSEALGKCLDVDRRRHRQRHHGAALGLQRHRRAAMAGRGADGTLRNPRPGAAWTRRAQAPPTARDW